MKAFKKTTALVLSFVMVFALFAVITPQTAMASTLQITVTPTVHNVVHVNIRDHVNNPAHNATVHVVRSDNWSPVSSNFTTDVNGNASITVWEAHTNVQYVVVATFGGLHNWSAPFWGGGGTGTPPSTTGGIGTPTVINEGTGWIELRASIPTWLHPHATNDRFGFVVSQWETNPEWGDPPQWIGTLRHEGGNAFIEGLITIPHHGQRFIFGAFQPSGNLHPNSPIHYSTVPLSITPGGVTLTWVNNPSFSTATGLITANGRLGSIGTSNITELGFVYSNTMSTPALNVHGTPVSGSFKSVAVSTITNAARDFSSSFAPEFAAGATGTTFWVRPYAINALGEISYGEIRTVTGVNLNLIGGGSVTLGSFTLTGGVNATATVTVTGIAAGNIDEWGIVYSNVNRTPARTGDTRNVFLVHGPINATTGDITLDGLTPNTTYFARAFVRARGGGQYIYSPVREIRTQSDISISMFAPSEITHNSALFSGNLTTTGNIVEMGFVYSRMNREPTLDDLSVSLPSPRTGNFNINATRLSPDTRYWVRAFVRHGTRAQDVVFSEVREFRTDAHGAVVSISFRDQFGQEFGIQTIHAAIGTVLTEVALNVPHGTRLANDRWSLTPRGNEHVVVQVIPDAAPPPPPPGPGPQPPGGVLIGYDPHNERPYMVGRPGGAFAPHEPGTVLEVATMLFTLMADPTQIYTYHQWFFDVDYSDPFQVNIINFVASRGYMAADPDGNFNPHRPITRAELAAVIVNALDLLNLYEHYGVWGWPTLYVDTEGHWANGFAFLTTRHGIFGGVDDMHFQPDVPVNRAQLAHAFSSLLNRSGMPMGHAPFTDVPPYHWAFTAIMNAAIPRP